MRRRFKLTEIVSTRFRRGQDLVPIVVAFLVLGTMGCSYGLHPHITLEGKPFSQEALARVQAGTSESEVLSALGEPLDIEEREPNLVVWRYYERARLRGCTVELLGFIPVDDSPMRTVEALIVLRGGAVEEVEWSEKE